MLKKQVKKTVEAVVEKIKKSAQVAPPKDKPIAKEKILCECGNPAFGGLAQCWNCSHRA